MKHPYTVIIAFSFNYKEWNIEVFGEMVDLTTITSTN